VEMAPYRFALGGAGALIDRGELTRSTVDLDFFTNQSLDTINIGDLTTWLGDLLNIRGRVVECGRMTPVFGELEVDGVQLDFVHDWRKHEPDQTPYGPRLHFEDLAASKLAALSSRLVNRDIVDVHELTQRTPIAELVGFAKEQDTGFSVRVAREMIDRHQHRIIDGFTAEHFDTAKQSLQTQFRQLEYGLSHPEQDQGPELDL